MGKFFDAAAPIFNRPGAHDRKFLKSIEIYREQQLHFGLYPPSTVKADIGAKRVSKSTRLRIAAKKLMTSAWPLHHRSAQGEIMGAPRSP